MLTGNSADVKKIVKGFVQLLFDVMLHSPELALFLLSAYSDFKSGDLVGLAETIKKAEPLLKDSLDGDTKT